MRREGVQGPWSVLRGKLSLKRRLRTDCLIDALAMLRTHFLSHNSARVVPANHRR